VPEVTGAQLEVGLILPIGSLGGYLAPRFRLPLAGPIDECAPSLMWYGLTMMREQIDRARLRLRSTASKWLGPFPALLWGLTGAALLILASLRGPATSISTRWAWSMASFSFGLTVASMWCLATLHSRSQQAKQQLAAAASETERLRAELVETRGVAEEAKRTKKEFLTNISHEIRTPMNGLMGMLELALGTHPNPEQQSYLQMATVSAGALLQVVNDLLDFSRIESGRFQLDPIDFDLRVSLLDVLAVFKSNAEKKGISLSFTISPEIPQLLIGDPTRLRQALRNIAENAIKFTEHGGIEIKLDCEPSGEKFINLLLTVHDTGIGISPQRLDRIFEPFEQQDGSSTREHGGIGLGMAIAARLAKSMDGRMWAESEPGKGSTFYFSARLGLSSRNVMHNAPDTLLLEGARTLIVDGRAVNRRSLSRTLADWRMRPFPVSTGRAALSAIKESAASGDPFTLILMDSELPDMDSFALSEQIKGNSTSSSVTVLILASAGLRGDAAWYRNLGIAAYLTKPILRTQLRDAMVTALRSRASEEVNRPLITRHTLREDRHFRVLVAEDNPVNQIMLVRFLEKYGHTVTVVSDGEQAVAQLENQVFDVVLMDIQMPKLDGFGATVKIRQREQAIGQHTPIIAVTANVVPGEKDHCLGMGMDGYIVKPLCVPELLQALDQVNGSIVSVEQKDAVIAPLAQHDEEVVSLFLTDTPIKIAELRCAWNQNNFDAVGRAAHYLKGSAMYLGEDRMSRLCEDIRVHAMTGDAAGIGELLGSLDKEFAGIEEGALWRKRATSWD
jgi:two-component system, sensor histidine kinase and response regulator